MKLSKAVISRCPKEPGSATLAAILSGWKARPTFQTSFKEATNCGGRNVINMKLSKAIISRCPKESGSATLAAILS
ncbi:MAG: hypothetical protein WCP55_01245, partial [Lentisphaerota bacterium]